MAAKGTESKGIVFGKLQEVYPNAFWEDEGKILRIPMTEGGNLVEIKVTLTAAKNLLGGTEMPSAFEAAPAPAQAPQVQMTEEEKDNVAKLLASLNM